MSSPYVIDYQEAFHLSVPPDEVWAAIQRVDLFESWWSWLREFHVDGGGLAVGAVLHGVVVPPLPYRMRLGVTICECAPPHLIEAVVHGDLEGRARLVLEPDEGGTRAHVAWTIEMMQQPMRLAARIAHPVLRWGHERVVRATVAGFGRQLARGRNTS